MPTPTIDPAATINETITRHPETVGVFTQFGLDACCGGAHAIQEAARRHRLELPALLAALEDAVAEPAR